MNEVESALRLSPAQFQKTYGFAKPQHDDKIVIYCRSGVRADKAGQMFLLADYADVHNYRGSFVEWFGFSYTM